MSKNYLYLLSLIFFITSCGGGGGGSSEPSVPAPTVSISLSSSSIVLGESVTINWSSSNASSCNANGSWSGSKATSGTESITPSGVGFFNYGISCSGSGGSRSSSVDLEVYRQTEGVSVDGYIRGAEIFIDKNNNFIADMGDENSTSSDNEGKFTIKYDDGNLISLGGIDLDTGNTLDNFLINQNLSGYSEFKVITPVTSVASFLNESTSINNVLGIDSSIDIFTFDPVANTGDGGINDYLYEKGNQLTVLAFSLQNIINNINSTTETTQDYFKSIAEEIDLEYAATSQKVDIETSNFVLNVLNNITIAKGVTLDEANKDNTVTALSGLLPIIEVKPSQDLTNSIFNFSTTTLQTDILTIADGTASEEVLTNYTTNIIEYIAQDQNIDSDEITPAITAINDSAETEEDSSVMINVIVNDSYITTAPISVLATNGSNGTTSLVESSPEQVVYSPNPDFNGTDSFSYTITQGDKTSSADVSLTVSQVQDDPVINISSSISTPENILSVTTISISDVDDDELTLTLSGADADAFNLSNENELSFKELPDYESKQQYALTLSLTDGNTTVTKDITILVTNVNDVAPVITSSSTFSASENQTFIGSVEASDVEGDDITFSISGTEISISSTGVLSFISAPDYESKTSYSATVTVSDGELIDTQDLIVSVLNVNDNSPVITSGSGFSVNENVSTIGTVQASDVDNDALAYSVTGSELQISNSGLLSFSDSNGADFESQSSYIAEVSVFDGVFTASQTIIITVNDINDNTPIISSSSLTPNENLVIIGSVSATDGDADSTLSFSISGADTLKDDRIFLEIDSKSGEISIASGRGVLDYETKSSYTINVTVSDGENSSTSPVTIDVQNILEDLIDYTFSISDGTAAVSPVLSVNATFDELTFVNGGSAYVALFSTGLTPIAEQFGNLIYPACAGTLGIYEMTSNDDRTSWSLIETLSDELSDLCTYTIELLINTNSETSDPSPPTDSIHRQTGNNRYANKPIQFEMYHWFDGMGFSPFGSDDPDVLYSNAVTIANPLADNIIDTADGGSLFLYSDDTYPSECSVNSYNVTITDALGFSETLTTPQVAFITADCLNAMAFNNISSVGGKFNFSIDVYSIEPMSLFKGYMYMPYKTNPGDTGNGGQASAELLTNNGTIRGDDNRIANLSFEFDREAAPSGDLDNVINTDGILYFEAIDESSLRIDYYYSSYEMNIPQVNGDADETAPLVNSISTSSFTDSNYPQRNFVKFEVDVTNNASSNGTITPIKDIWISFTGGPSCANRVVYVRDELDGKLDTSTSLFTATVPFLKSDEGTYMITGYNINDHGYAETYYGGSVNHIGDTFTVGNDIDQTCPLFTQNYGSGSITVDVEENTKTIGTFPATGPSADTITYSLVAIDSGSGSIIDLVTINSSTGELSYKDSPDYEGDITYSGSVGIKAQYYNTLSRQLNVTVNLINLNDNPPVFTSSATLSADENQTAIGCVSVTDADAVANAPELGKCATTNGITFTVTGDNLEISEDGRLSFTSAPDYETKSSYTGTVTASDGDFSTTQDITVNINDLNDNDPIVTSDTTFTVSENQTGVGQITVSDGDANSSFTFAIVSDYEDGALFNVDSDGVITFKANANHETAGQYTIKVNISDGANTVAQIFTINLTDVCEFDFNNVVYTGEMIENPSHQTMVYSSDTNNSKFFYEFNIDTTDDACSVPDTETYSFSLVGDDASKFTLSSATGNDTDTHYIYLDTIFDHENPSDSDSNNVYDVDLSVTLGDFTETKDLSLTVYDLYEFGEIQSFTFDESTAKFTITYLTNHDLPENTTQLKFHIRGPSFPDVDNLLQATVDYDPSVSNYTIVLDAAAALTEDSEADGNEDTTIYGGYYSIYYIDALGSDGNLVINNDLGYLRNYEIMGSPRHIYYERSDGSNLLKVDSAVASLTHDTTNNTILFNLEAQASNISYDIPNTSSNRETINVRLESSNDLERLRGYGSHPSFTSISTRNGDSNDLESFNAETGEVNSKLYFNPNLRSGNHRYRLALYDRGRGNDTYTTFIYWNELIAMGIVTQDPLAHTNISGTSDIEGPKVASIAAQVKDYTDMSCTWNPDSEGNSGTARLVDAKTVLSITDESLVANDPVSTFHDARVRLYFSNFDASDNLIDNLTFDTDSTSISGTTKTFNLDETREDITINDTSDANQFILKPRWFAMFDSAGNKTEYYDAGDLREAKKYPNANTLFDNIDLRDYCNFNLGDNAPVFTSDSSFTINEGETAVTTLSATDADGDSVSYYVGTVQVVESDGDSSLFSVDGSTGALSFKQAPDYESPGDLNTDNVYSVTVGAYDNFNRTEQTLSVTVSNINDTAPAFSSSGSFTANENQTAIGTVAASDADGDTVAYSLSGTDADSLEINSSTGVLTFKTAPDYETKSSYSAEAIASDGTNASAQTISITVVNVNEFTPTFTSASSFTVAENQTTGPTIAASDGDGDTLTYSISGGTDASSFEINSSSGAITFKSAPDYETKSSYQLSVRASDGTNIAAQDITVNIGNLNEHAPSLSLSNPYSVNEGSTTVTTVTATDADGDETITFSIFDTGNSCTDQDIFSIGESTGVLTFKSAPDYENPADSDTDNEYKVCVKASDNGGAAGTYFEETSRGGAATITINVQNLNDASPVFTSNSTFNVDENQTTIGTVTATDADSGTITYSISDGSSVISINSSTGALTFNSAPNYEVKSRYPPAGSSTESYVVTASDGTNSTTQSLTLVIVDVNDPPTATAASYFMNLLPQSQTSGTITLAGTDEDGDTLTYSIVSNGSHGTASLSGATATYQSAADTQSAQSESFTFKVNDGTVDSSAATISIDLRTDPLYQHQWHLNNTGQTNFATNGGTSGADLNVDSVIVSGITGSGVRVNVVDEGLEIAHEDLVDNIVANFSYDFIGNDNDPTRSANDGDHGTSVAGIIASKGWNNKGGRGVAPNAELIGFNYLETGAATAANETIALYSSALVADVDIFNMSYGFIPNGQFGPANQYSSPLSFRENAVLAGASGLRAGKGAIYVKSSGNSWATTNNANNDSDMPNWDANFDYSTSEPEVITVGALNADDTRSSYSTPGASLWISSYGGESGWNNSHLNSQGISNQASPNIDTAIMTTDQSSCSKGYVSSNGSTGGVSGLEPNEFNDFSGDYSENSSCNYHSTFNGTSSAAPNVSGVVALMLEKNPNLTWRDVRHILASTATQVDASSSKTVQGISQYSWVTNAANYKYNPIYGFGKINAADAVTSAGNYTAGSLGNQVAYMTDSGTINATINSLTSNQYQITVSNRDGYDGIIEWIRIGVRIDHADPSEFGMRLLSPSGTIHNIMFPYTAVTTNPSGSTFELGIGGFYGESVAGTWTLVIDEYTDDGVDGVLEQWDIRTWIR